MQKEIEGEGRDAVTIELSDHSPNIVLGVYNIVDGASAARLSSRQAEEVIKALQKAIKENSDERN